LSDGGILRGRGRHGMSGNRVQRKRLELTAEFKKASDTRNFKKRVKDAKNCALWTVLKFLRCTGLATETVEC
jgi:hypothetical protein